jgi:hypothetical protein
MRRTLILMVSVVAIIASLILVTTVVASGDSGSQRWNLDSVGHSLSGKVMEKTGTQSDNVSISAGGNQVWLSKNDAGANVTFSGGSWVIYLKTMTNDNWEAHCTAVVGGWNTNSGWYAFSTTTGTAIWLGDGILKVEIQNNSETIPKDDYLALKVMNSDSTPHYVITDGYSYLISPTTDPGYPLPEISAGILLALGLGGLGGYVVIRRKRAREETKT